MQAISISQTGQLLVEVITMAALLLFIFIGVAAAGDDVCKISEDNRVDCHHAEDDCHAAGCCWHPVTPNPKNLPWCYFNSSTPSPSPPPPPSPQCQKIAVDDRLDCGHSGDESGCRVAGCCWEPVDPDPDNTPWCYFSDRKMKHCTLGGEPKAPFSAAEIEEVKQYFIANLDVDGSGMVVAAPDHNTGPGGDYYFAWMRDGALSMNAYLQTSEASDEVFSKMDAWLAWAERSQQQADPNGIDILTEPKFNIPAGTPFTGGWCRPQNDGPGLRAITLIAYASARPSVAQKAWSIVKKELDWVAANYTSEGCDLWEEVRSQDFFWNRYTMRKALLQGAAFAKSVGGDSARSTTYSSVAQQITAALSSHIDPNGFVFESTNRRKDTAVIEAFNVGDMDDGTFAPLSREVVATLKGLGSTFCKAFKLNQDAANANVSGLLFGRYEGDSYAGGNPWILLTASVANLLYRQAEASAKGTIPAKDVAESLAELLGRGVTPQSLLGAGDATLLYMKKYMTNGMHMNEQMDRTTGKMLSAKDLTWNYANVLKAMKARAAAADAMGNSIIV